MATATLSLFPSPSLKNKSGQKGSLLYGSRSAKEPDFEMVKMSDSAQGIVIAVHETSAPKRTDITSEEQKSPSSSPEQPLLPSIVLSAPPKAQTANSPASTVRPRTPSPKATQVQFTSKSGSPVKSPSRSRAPSPLQLEGSPQSHTTSPTLVRKGSNASTRTGTHSPIMRSMFPRYDPTIPLNQQHYYPRAHIERPSLDVSRPTYSPSLYTHQNRHSLRPSVPALVIPPRSAAAPILQQTPAESTPIIFSAPDELLRLWDIANGQGCDGADDVLRIELGCDSLNQSSETISFSSPSQQLYTLSASSASLIASRTHPLHPTPTIRICETTLCTPTATSPLVATIFPKLAELMAVDQSSSIAVTHRLDRHASDDLQTEAISRARLNEASNLVWDSDSDRYFIIHPTLLDNASTTFPIEITPNALNPEQIVISAPETNGATPLLSLSLTTRTLTIHTGPVKALPSLYTLDTLITTLLTLLLHLHRLSAASNLPTTTAQDPAVVAPTFPPPPTLLTLANRPKRRTLSTWSKSVFSRDRRAATDIEAQTQHAEAKAEEEVTIVQQSSEHDWTFQPLVNADDQTLPAATRGVLRTLYWAFQVFVWVLGVGVNLVAAGVVGLGRLVKKA